jgi:hypothetical protein
MTSEFTPALLITIALQQVFEICSDLASSAPPDRRRALDDRLRRLQGVRTELLDWVDANRPPAA